MWKVHSVMCEYVAKWRACFIYWSVWSNKLETLHIRLQFASLLKCFAFFLLLTLPSLRNKPTAEQPHFSEPVSPADINGFTPQMNVAVCASFW